MMTGTIVPAERLEALRKERERLRQQHNSFSGSILGLLDDDEDAPPCAPASPAPKKETKL